MQHFGSQVACRFPIGGQFAGFGTGCDENASFFMNFEAVGIYGFQLRYDHSWLVFMNKLFQRIAIL